MIWRISLLCALLLNAAWPGAGALAQATDLPTGRVRMGIVLANTAFVTKDPSSGELRGLIVDLGRGLAARAGVPFEAVEYPNDAQRLAGLRAGAFDVTNASTDPGLFALADVTAPFAEIDTTYMVPAGSPIQRVADADRPGVRIAVAGGAGADNILSAALKQGTLVRADTQAAAFELLRSGQADAYAANRQNLVSFTGRLPGARLLADRFAVQEQVLAVPKGRPSLFALARAFVEEAKASGTIEQSIARAGVQGVQAAPPAGALPRAGEPPLWLATVLLGGAALAAGRRLRRSA